MNSNGPALVGSSRWRGGEGEGEGRARAEHEARGCYHSQSTVSPGGLFTTLAANNERKNRARAPVTVQRRCNSREASLSRYVGGGGVGRGARGRICCRDSRVARAREIVGNLASSNRL